MSTRRVQPVARLAPALAALALGAAALPARGVEMVEAMVAALCEQRLHDVAVDYLEGLRDSALVDDAQKRTLGFRQGAALVSGAAQTRDLAIKRRLLDDARARLEAFLKAEPRHELAGAANNELAKVLMEHGRLKAAEAALPEATDKGALAEAARQAFAAAQKNLDSAEQGFAGRLRTLPKFFSADQQPLKLERQQAERDLVLARMLSAEADYELARLAGKGSAEHARRLKAAGEKYAAVASEFRTLLIGLSARLREGICYQELGDYRLAVGCYLDLAELPPEPHNRVIRAKATRQALECLTHPDQRRYAEALRLGELWQRGLPPGRAPDADALAIRYFLGIASHQDSLGRSSRDPQRVKLLDTARQQIAQVARLPGEYQKPAKTLLVKLGADKKPGEKTKEPATFAEAFARAKEAFEQMKFAAAGMEIARQNGNEEPIPELKKQEAEGRELSSRYFRLALRLADNKSPLADLNQARYFVCALSYNGGEYYDAAVLGDYLARHFPDSPEGRQGALVAMRSYAKIYLSAKSGGQRFEAAQVLRLAEMIHRRWPDQPEAVEAAQTLVAFLVQEKQFDKAAEYLAKIPETSPQRRANELYLGNSAWAAYQAALRVPAGERPKAEELERLKQQARSTLTAAVARTAAADPVDANLVVAVLALVRLHLEAGQVDQALALLEHKQYGPLTLLATRNKLASDGQLPVEINQLALQAYVSASPPRIDEVQAAMDQLEKLIGQDDRSGEKLTRIYIALGVGLQRQLQELKSAGKQEAIKQVAAGFELFLKRIIERPQGLDFKTLAWAAETFFSLGSGLDSGKPTDTAARGYYEQSAKAFERILELAKADPAFLPQAEMRVTVRLRLAKVLAQLGKFDESRFDAALQLVGEVIKEKPATLSAQILGAEVLQARGVVKPEFYTTAVNGSLKGDDGKNLIWGWGLIARLTQRNAKLSATFHLARQRIAECHLQRGLAESDPAQRRGWVERAKGVVQATYQMYPELGGAESKAQYDALLKKIQTGLEEPAGGLSALKTPPPVDGKSPDKSS